MVKYVGCLLQCFSPVINVTQLSLSQTYRSPKSLKSTNQSVELGQSPKLSTTQYFYPYSIYYSLSHPSAPADRNRNAKYFSKVFFQQVQDHRIGGGEEDRRFAST
jgi:hypothetical protein